MQQIHNLKLNCSQKPGNYSGDPNRASQLDYSMQYQKISEQSS